MVVPEEIFFKSVSSRYGVSWNEFSGFHEAAFRRRAHNGGLATVTKQQLVKFHKTVIAGQRLEEEQHFPVNGGLRVYRVVEKHPFPCVNLTTTTTNCERNENSTELKREESCSVR